MPQEPGKIRNVAVLGHRGSGKTSLVEALLFQAGAINRLGSVGEGTTVADYDDDEKRRSLSISCSLCHAEWHDRRLNIIDTPGDPSFQGDALGPLRVVEGAIFVVSGVAGVEVSTDRFWRRAAEREHAAPRARQPARPRAQRLRDGLRVDPQARRARRRRRHPDGQGARVRGRHRRAAHGRLPRPRGRPRGRPAADPGRVPGRGRRVARAARGAHLGVVRRADREVPGGRGAVGRGDRGRAQEHGRVAATSSPSRAVPRPATPAPTRCST